MATYTAHLDFAAVFQPPNRCPGCGHLGLQAVLGTDVPIFRCPSCAGRWRFVLGRFFSVSDER
ncbi:MAG TPA: zf-TFIIB domain-containing protein [Jiangellaceae bacterium]